MTRPNQKKIRRDYAEFCSDRLLLKSIGVKEMLAMVPDALTGSEKVVVKKNGV